MMSDKISYVTLIILIVFNFSCSTSEKKIAQGRVPTTLVIGLDGISYFTFKKMQDGGHFRSFTQVAPMVASFPSISDPNWTRLMNLPPEKGFTKAYFDPTIKTANGLGQENGSLAAHLMNQPLYERVMDFKQEGVWEHLTMFIWTDTTARYWLESLEKKFFEFRGRDTYFTLIVNTDVLSHTEGEEKIMQYLAEIENRIDKIQAHYREMYSTDLDVVLVSDHGNGYFHPLDIPFETELEKDGWHLADTLSNAKDYGFYVPEILSFGAFFCQPHSAKALALSLSKVSHVQSAMYESPQGEIHVYGDRGLFEGLVTVDKIKDTVFYKVLRGKDIFDQQKYFRKGPLHSVDYFQRSLSDPYPNLAYRIWEGFNTNSQIKPPVLVNAELGYVFGNKALRLLTDIRGFSSAHGSLHRSESLGIFASTKRQMPAIRPQDFQKFVDVRDIGKITN